ncbi:MAG: zinc ribbon domain-containing protein [Chloroflexi bacterium]|nr:zinc ribbon domain-containing protein [Chloroflexota bacterium]MBM3154094.1 zinc ribbon domain-containing protein [Chloroflexota bacterium]MBM3172905.1 zinc ribbon domain-containing protein [Chloroflexota bacterium]MBM3174818.1 zinc ribbon domain-containing protein [Chloroflexota bacterium]MBM4450925.1 zinc ribbon domain-containing protein [Chloroflexota bacterium]
MQQPFRCLRCGAPLMAGQPFCANCGLPVQRSCPRCRAFLSPQATFCTNCGLALVPGAPPPGRQQAKPKSTVSIIGDILFGLGIACAIFVPIWTIVRQPDAENSMSVMIGAFAIGGVMAVIGLIMMRKR